MKIGWSVIVQTTFFKRFQNTNTWIWGQNTNFEKDLEKLTGTALIDVKLIVGDIYLQKIRLNMLDDSCLN